MTNQLPEDMSLPYKKYSLYNRITGAVAQMKSDWDEPNHKPTICNQHIVLANEIDMLLENGTVKQQLLERLDICYDMGKRMGNKMLADHKKSGKKSGWREGY